MSGLLPQHGEILLYNNGTDKQFVSVVFKDETFWLTQSGMAELFDCSADNISLHLKNIYADGELEQAATTEKFSVVRNCRRWKKLSDTALQSRRHHRRRLPGQLQKGHPLPPMGHQDPERVHPEGLCPQR